MYALTIVFGSPALPWSFLFNTKEGAEEAFANFQATKATDFSPSENFLIHDDFGQFACLKRNSIHGGLLEDMDKSKLAAVERGIHQAKTQIAAEKRGQQDPEIQAFNRTRAMAGGPAMLAPGMSNGVFRQ